MNWNKVNELIGQGYISKQKHPTEDLYIYNYTNKCQFDKLWNEETISCRGLITDRQNNILYRPFKKFFNYSEIKEDEIPSGEFEITEKWDGSLGILYWINNVPYIATRGSFTSDQAIKGTEILRKMDINNFHKDYTYLFEIIYSKNRVVVDYKNKEDLILLAIIDTKNGYELNISNYPYSHIEKINGIQDFKTLINVSQDNKEGFVIKWANGFRLKMKFDEYVRLHKLICGLSERRIWDALRSGDNIESFFEKVPDEFYTWGKKIIYKLSKLYDNIEQDSLSIVIDEGLRELPRKNVAIITMNKYRHYSAIIFKILDGKDYKNIIWKMIKPSGNKIFKIEI